MKKCKSLILLIGLIVLTTLNSCKKSNVTPNTNSINNIEQGIINIHVDQSCSGTTKNLSNGIIKIYSNQENYNNNIVVNTYTTNGNGDLKTTLDYQPNDYYITVTGTLTIGNCSNSIKTSLFKRTIVANNTTNVFLSIGT